MQGLQPSLHIVTDNHYFAGGAAAWCEHDGLSLPVRVRTTLLSQGDEDLVGRRLSAPHALRELTLLSVSDIRLRRQILWRLGRQGASVLVMAPPGLFIPGQAWLNSHDVAAMPDNVTVGLFWSAVRRRLARGQAAPWGRESSGREVIYGLGDGESVAALSRRLGCPEKAVYSTKARIMKRAGLTGVHGLILCRDLVEYRELYLAQARRGAVAA